MKRIALLAVIGAGLMALPSSAAAQTTCPNGQNFEVRAPNPIYACVNVNGFGGDITIATDGSYGWIDGAQNNPGPGSGYAGFNNGGITEPDPDDDCNGIDEDDPSGGHDGPDTNTGGCFWIRPAPQAVNDAINDDDTPTSVVTDMFFCGNTSGTRTGSTRDGCSIP